MTTFERVTKTAARYLHAFNPYFRMLRDVPATTPETKELSELRVRGDDPQADTNRARVQEFVDRENGGPVSWGDE